MTVGWTMARMHPVIGLLTLFAATSSGCKKKTPIPPLAPVSPASVMPTHGTLWAGGFDTCARRSDGSLWCWGTNELGQLGDGTRVAAPAPVRMKGGEDFLDVSLSGDHTCVITRAHAVRCWGHNLYGEAGAKRLEMAAPATDVLQDVRQVATGDFVTCAVRGDGSVWCWGMNDNGQLGDGTKVDRFEPRPVPGLVDIARVAAGYGGVCAQSNTGGVWCWGSNQYGQCGVGRPDRVVARPTPIAMAAATVATGLVEASFESCFVGVDQVPRCWGQGNHGAAGTGAPENVYTPAVLSWASAVDAVAVGGFAHACLRRTDGTVWCWGYPIGAATGTIGEARLKPQPVPGLVATELALGHTHACARRVDGTIVCWGEDDQGQLGDGSTTPRVVPVQVDLPP
jgi:alpha-tubulin suppressor-like RCC1 family protein